MDAGSQSYLHFDRDAKDVIVHILKASQDTPPLSISQGSSLQSISDLISSQMNLEFVWKNIAKGTTDPRVEFILPK